MSVKKNMSNLALGMSIIALVCSATTACLSLKAFNMDDMAYVGVIIAILALLVTLLIGWNIYAVIDVKDYKREVDEELKDIKKEQNMNQAQLFSIAETMNLELFRTVFEIHVRNSKISDSNEHVLRYGLLYLESALNLKQKDSIAAIHRILHEMILQRIDLSVAEKDRIRSIITKIDLNPNACLFEDYYSIRELIMKFVLFEK